MALLTAGSALGWAAALSAAPGCPPEAATSGTGTKRVDYPKEILDKIGELQRTHLEMRLALTQEKPDLEKARSLFSRAQEIRNEISLWRFESYIESLKK